jgi:hypothetical protein
MGTFLSQKPSKIVQFGTHTPSNRIILVAQRLIFQPTLEYLSKISILRSKIGTYCSHKPSKLWQKFCKYMKKIAIHGTPLQ